jgi:hypothetical protein
VFSKLGITSRVELARLARDREIAGSWDAADRGA